MTQPFLSPLTDTQSPDHTILDRQAELDQCRTEAVTASNYLSGADWGLTDTEREEAIERIGALMVSAMELWEATGEFAYRGDADRLRLRMEALIKSRPALFVRSLEIKRGLI